jgi:hypothetical protein
MTSKNYSNPAVWEKFLREQGLPAETPAPSITFCCSLAGAPDPDAKLIKWARQHDPVELRRIARDHQDARREACEESAEFLSELDLDR